MRKNIALISALVLVTACSSHDPILPGYRTPVFENQSFDILNQSISELGTVLENNIAKDCPYSQDSENIIWKGDKKIFSGFPTANSVKSNQAPVCSGKYVYAGLTTGELVKINPANKDIVWVADIYSTSNMTGGSSILDIVAPIFVNNSYVYVGGLGDAFCKINNQTGAKKWCVKIGTALPFIITDKNAFVVGTDNNLYAIRLTDGAVYWRAKIGKQAEPVLTDSVITVADIKVDAASGTVIEEE